jgi:hypothetical protein
METCLPDDHPTSSRTLLIGRMIVCAKGVARAVVCDINGVVVAEAPMVETTIITPMLPALPTRDVYATMVNWVGTATGINQAVIDQVESGPIRFVMHCTPVATPYPHKCDTVGGDPSSGDNSITKRVSEWRSIGQGTQWTFAAGKGDGYFIAPDTKKYERAAAYDLDSFGEWVGGTNNTWGLVQFRCDYATYVNPLGTTGPQTGCVFPGALDTFRRLSQTNDAEAPLSARPRPAGAVRPELDLSAACQEPTEDHPRSQRLRASAPPKPGPGEHRPEPK